MNDLNVATAFSSPVGFDFERAAGKVWPGEWIDSNPYASYYTIKRSDGIQYPAYHTGADLNLPRNDDFMRTFYAIANGKVTAAKYYPLPSSAGNVIIVEHLLPTGRKVYSRYAHSHEMQVKVGQAVKRGDPLGLIGTSNGLFGAHLHFDISLTNILLTKPDHWSGTNLANLKLNYTDPKAYLIANADLFAGPIDSVIVQKAVNLRTLPRTDSAVFTILPAGTKLRVKGRYVQSGYHWSQLVDDKDVLLSKFVAREFLILA